MHKSFARCLGRSQQPRPVEETPVQDAATPATAAVPVHDPCAAQRANLAAAGSSEARGISLGAAEEHPEQPASKASCEDSAVVSGLSADVAAAMGYPYQVHELGPPRPPCEEDRMKTMQALGLIDAPPDPELDTVLKLIMTIFDAPTALVGLFDDTKIFITDASGFFRRGDFPWRWSFCGWTMGSKNNMAMVIPDTYEDARPQPRGYMSTSGFADNVYVRPPSGDPGIRFYAGTPLVASDGHRLGTLCFADYKPRAFDAAQCALLNTLASVVVRQIEKDIRLQMVTLDNKALYKKLAGGLDCLNLCLLLVDTTVPGFKILYVNEAWETLTSTPRDTAIGSCIVNVLERSCGQPVLGEVELAAANLGRDFTVADVVIKGDRWPGQSFILSFRPATQNPVEESAAPIGVPSFVPTMQPPAAVSKLYFVTVQKMPSSPVPSSVAFSHNSVSSSMKEAGWLLHGLVLTHLLGTGSIGSVYAGWWCGISVAVKVTEQDLDDANSHVVGMEAALAMELRHPHIVSTLECFVRKSVRRLPRISYGYAAPGTRDQRQPRDVSSGVAGGHPAVRTTIRPHESSVKSSGIGMAGHSSAAAAGGVDIRQGSRVVAGQGRDHAGAWAVIDYSQLEGASASIHDPAFGSFSASTENVQPPHSEAAEVVGPTSREEPEQHQFRDIVQTWIVMEYCDKGCLQDAIDRGWLLDRASCVSGRPRMDAVLATAHEIASAMAYLHSEGIIHGDLSAFNVLLMSAPADSSTGSRGFVSKICDFGMARDLGPRSRHLIKPYGTLTHQPPEALTAGIISKAVDVYSFGVLLWQMYTCSRPWAGMGHAQMVAHVVSTSDQLRFPSEAPRKYAELAVRCMAFKPEDRPDFDTVCHQLLAMQAVL